MARTKQLPLITPHEDKNGVMLCSERCPQHDGKRCELLGHRPDRICYPWAEQARANELTPSHTKKLYRIEPIDDSNMR